MIYMKLLKDLVNTEIDIQIDDIIEDSRIKKENTLFCAIKGIERDGHDFVNDAINNGAVAILSEKPLDVSVPVIVSSDTSVAMNQALNNYYDKPLDKLKLIAITGTDGKTTIANMIYQILNKYHKSSLIGTYTAECDNCSLVNVMTTPFPCKLFKFFDAFNKNDCQYTVMEVSSERLGTNRMNGINYDISILTNITPDHLDTHKTMDNYVDAKCKLFENTKKDGLCIINNDSQYADTFINKSNAKVITYGLTNKAELYASDIVVLDKMVSFKLNGYLGEHDIVSPLSGVYNVYNLLAAIIALNHTGICIEDIIKEIKYLKHVPGRNEHVDVGQPFKVIVDFAHTANGWKVLYDYTKSFTKGRIIAVFGSKGKHENLCRRATIGKMICDNADYAIITTEHPKFEDPMKIITEGVLKDVTTKNYEIILERKEAIKKAITIAKPNDTILITGKGLETYEDIKGVKVPYDGDIAVAKQYLEEIFSKN